MDIFRKNLDLRRKYHKEFEQTFNVRLAPFFDNLTGFDSIKFDQEVVKSEWGCMRDAVRTKWGDAGVELILNLIGGEPNGEDRETPEDPGHG